MNATYKNNSLQLRKRGVEWLKNVQPGTTITCEQGILWLTQSGDRRDYILLPGDRIAKQKRGTVLVEAMRDAVVRVN